MIAAENIDFADIAFPKREHSTLRDLRDFYLKNNLRELLSLFAKPSPILKDSNPSVWDILRVALRKNSPALLQILFSPAISIPLRCYSLKNKESSLAKKIERAFHQITPNLLHEMSTARLLPNSGAKWIGNDDLFSHGLGLKSKLQGKTKEWFFENGDSKYIPLKKTSVPLRGPIQLALSDSNPIAKLETHPEKSGNIFSLGGRSVESWRKSLVSALDWIADFWPTLFEEMEILLQRVVPVGFSKTKHLSASYREAIGTIYMTLHPNPLTMSEALIHEFQHNKLNLASYADSFLENAFSPLYSSPVRPDPRPLWGVLLAAHAFLPVAVFYRKIRAAKNLKSTHSYLDKKIVKIDAQNREAMDTLRTHARWTTTGRSLMSALEEIEHLHSKDIVP